MVAPRQSISSLYLLSLPIIGLGAVSSMRTRYRHHSSALSAAYMAGTEFLTSTAMRILGIKTADSASTMDKITLTTNMLEMMAMPFWFFMITRLMPAGRLWFGY